MGFWHTVATDLRRYRWGVGVCLFAAIVHTVFTGFSMALLGCLGLIFCLSPAFRKWCWRQPISPSLLGAIYALAMIFFIETYLGVSTRVFGTFDHPGRQPMLLEGPLIRTLGRLYNVRPRQYFELLLAAIVGIKVTYSALHFRRHKGSSEQKHKGHDRAKWIEVFTKVLESACGITLVLGTLVFANAVDLKATGLNSIAALYESERRQLGSNAAAIAELQKQLANLRETNEAFTRDPIPPNARSFLDATDALIDALWQLEQPKTSQIAPIMYKANEDPLPNLTVSLPLPPVPAPPPESDGAEIYKKILLRFSEFTDIQRQAEAAEREAKDIRKTRDDELFHLGGSISLLLDRAHRLTQPEKARLLAAIVDRIAALIARDGIQRATLEIRNLTTQKQNEASERRKTKNTHVPAKNDLRVEEKLPGSSPRVMLPGSPSLKQFAPFIDMVRADGVYCGGASNAIGNVIEKVTVHLRITDQNGTLHSNPGGTHYHVRLTQNKTGGALPNGGFWIDIPNNLKVTADQAHICSARLGGEKCDVAPMNIIWTDDNYPTQDNPSVRPTVYCYWPWPTVQ